VTESAALRARASDWLETAKSLAPLAATLFGVLYASGYAIVNSFFAQYGIHDLDAVRVRYIGSGITFLLAVGFALFGAQQIWQYAHRWTRSRWRRIGIGVAGLILVPLIAAVGELTVLARTLSPTILSADAVTSYFATVSDPTLVWGVISLNQIVIGPALLYWSTRPLRRHLWGQAVNNWVIIVAVVGVLGAIGVYSTAIFPTIPQWLGGGKLEAVRIVTTQLVADACPRCVNETVYLVDEEASRVVIVARNAKGDLRGVSIQRNEVKAILHE
jgi:hypothetical protein